MNGVNIQWALSFYDLNLAYCFPQVVKREGSGIESPMIGDKVTVHYTGWLLDGTKFDSSLDRRDKFLFDLGKGSIISCSFLISFGNNQDEIFLCMWLLCMLKLLFKLVCRA